MARKKTKPPLSALEGQVMELLWKLETATAETVRERLGGVSKSSKQLKDSTVRTILRRLEEKGYVAHHVDGRTYVYRPVDDSQRVAADAVRGLIDQFCSGSVENLLIGVVENEILTPEQLVELANKIASAEQQQQTDKSALSKKSRKK